MTRKKTKLKIKYESQPNIIAICICWRYCKTWISKKKEEKLFSVIQKCTESWIHWNYYRTIIIIIGTPYPLYTVVRGKSFCFTFYSIHFAWSDGSMNGILNCKCYCWIVVYAIYTSTQIRIQNTIWNEILDTNYNISFSYWHIILESHAP